MYVLVTGATGTIGARLVPELLDRGHRVRVMVRTPRKLEAYPWGDDVEVVQADLDDPTSLPPALEGVEAAYYLVHAMGQGADFAQRDREAARAFAAAGQHLEHCIYLGGLQPRGTVASHHLASRAEVGAILARSLPTTEFRAGPVIGPGSGSFEMLAYLTERLPIMVAPKWIDNAVQPVAMADVVAYLATALDQEPLGILDIGCPEPSTFREMMEVYADVRGLRRKIFSVPVLTPRLASLWVGLVTPISNRLATPLIEGIVEPVVADLTRARQRFPDIEPMAYREALERAVAAKQR